MEHIEFAECVFHIRTIIPDFCFALVAVDSKQWTEDAVFEPARQQLMVRR